MVLIFYWWTSNVLKGCPMSNLTIAPLIGKVATEKRNLDPLADRLFFFFKYDYDNKPYFLGGTDSYLQKKACEAALASKIKKRYTMIITSVDVRNPAPVDKRFIPLMIGFQPYKVVHRISLAHPQYIWNRSQRQFHHAGHSAPAPFEGCGVPLGLRWPTTQDLHQNDDLEGGCSPEGFHPTWRNAIH